MDSHGNSIGKIPLPNQANQRFLMQNNNNKVNFINANKNLGKPIVNKLYPQPLLNQQKYSESSYLIPKRSNSHTKTSNINNFKFRPNYNSEIINNQITNNIYNSKTVMRTSNSTNKLGLTGVFVRKLDNNDIQSKNNIKLIQNDKSDNNKNENLNIIKGQPQMNIIPNNQKLDAAHYYNQSKQIGTPLYPHSYQIPTLNQQVKPLPSPIHRTNINIIPQHHQSVQNNNLYLKNQINQQTNPNLYSIQNQSKYPQNQNIHPENQNLNSKYQQQTFRNEDISQNQSTQPANQSLDSPSQSIKPVNPSLSLPSQSSTIQPVNPSLSLPSQSSKIQPVNPSLSLPSQSSKIQPVNPSLSLPSQSSKIQPIDPNLDLPNQFIQPINPSLNLPNKSIQSINPNLNNLNHNQTARNTNNNLMPNQHQQVQSIQSINPNLNTQKEQAKISNQISLQQNMLSQYQINNQNALSQYQNMLSQNQVINQNAYQQYQNSHLQEQNAYISQRNTNIPHQNIHPIQSNINPNSPQNQKFIQPLKQNEFNSPQNIQTINQGNQKDKSPDKLQNPNIKKNNDEPNKRIEDKLSRRSSLRESRNKSPPQIICTKDGQLKRSGADFSGNHYDVATDDEKIVSDRDISSSVNAYLNKEISFQMATADKPKNNKVGNGFRFFGHLTKAGRNQNGKIKTNQDTPLVHLNVGNIHGFNLFGVLDGHGPHGHFVSQFCRDHFINHMTNYAESCKKKGLTTPEAIYNELKTNKYAFIIDLYHKADSEMSKQKNFDYNFSGTTCNIIYQFNKNLVCASVGDSRSILIYDKGDSQNQGILPLSTDHKPDLPGEIDRIKLHGGIVEQITGSFGNKVGPNRVWKAGENYPGLAMSRSLGDFKAKECGVIPSPQIIEHTINKNSKYAIICSDGVWEFIQNEQVRDLGNAFYKKNDVGGFCQELVKCAVHSWENFDIIRDDITVICVYF